VSSGGSCVWSLPPLASYCASRRVGVPIAAAYSLATKPGEPPGPCRVRGVHDSTGGEAVPHHTGEAGRPVFHLGAGCGTRCADVPTSVPVHGLPLFHDALPGWFCLYNPPYQSVSASATMSANSSNIGMRCPDQYPLAPSVASSFHTTTGTSRAPSSRTNAIPSGSSSTFVYWYSMP